MAIPCTAHGTVDVHRYKGLGYEIYHAYEGIMVTEQREESDPEGLDVMKHVHTPWKMEVVVICRIRG